MQSSRLTRYACGDVGYEVESRGTSGRQKVKGFIRVAEIRGEPVEPSDKNCPNHSKGS